MKILLYIILTALFAPGFSPSTEQPDRILGKWISLQRNVIVEVFKDSSRYKGKIVWFDDSDDKSRPLNERRDINNPDTNLRNRKIIGLDVLVGLTYNKKCNCWQNGKIYDTNSGKVWSSSIKMESGNLLKIRGFWHFEFLGRTMTFKRLS